MLREVEIVDDKTLPLQIALPAKVDEIANPLASDTDIAEQLRLMLRTQLLQRLQLDNNLAKHNRSGRYFGVSRCPLK